MGLVRMWWRYGRRVAGKCSGGIQCCPVCKSPMVWMAWEWSWAAAGWVSGDWCGSLWFYGVVVHVVLAEGEVFVCVEFD